MKNLSDQELIVLYHLINLSDKEFEDSLHLCNPNDKRDIQELHFNVSMALFNKVQDEVNARNEEVKRLTNKVEYNVPEIQFN